MNLDAYVGIVGFENYLINKQGNIYSKNRNKLLKSKVDKDGYLEISLCNNGKRKYWRLHRLVGFSFIPNPLNKPFMNHKNGIKDDNRVENLEWCTQSENEKHAYRIGLKKPSYSMKGKIGKLCPSSKKVEQLDLNGNLIKVWDYMSSAATKLNISLSCISECCHKKQKTAGGYKWRLYK